MQPFKHLVKTLSSLWSGLKLTSFYLYKGLTTPSPKTATTYPANQQHQNITLTYPHTKLPVPPRGRYQLNNNIEDCIVCDKCVKICPVDCITIEAIPAPTVFGLTSNGMKKRIHPAKFDINLAQCCFCGLCTTVCPTSCLTMTDQYDFSVTDIQQHVFSFATLSPAEITAKKAEWAAYQANNTNNPPIPKE